MRIRGAMLLSILLLGTVLGAAAQTEAIEWDVPVNLSRSGAASAPSFVVDSAGDYHVFWQDAFAGYMYLTGDGETWNEPIPVRLPFTQAPYAKPLTDTFEDFYNPLVVAGVAEVPDEPDLLHAFWIDEDFGLRYSRALTETIANGSAGWTAPAPLAEPVAKVDVTVGEDGRLHLIYIHSGESEELVPGLFYRVSDDQGNSWSDPVLLYESS
ncbi:MAG: hypothetical protein GY943_35620, partial [Chloroflexi bacterium]|nr:hypothetical protein [Chloroflexota bacterium]